MCVSCIRMYILCICSYVQRVFCILYGFPLTKLECIANDTANDKPEVVRHFIPKKDTFILMSETYTHIFQSLSAPTSDTNSNTN